ncbi:hypothetical protein RGU76_08020 [Bacillus pseudomycoides]|uniref:hypothetical protein n=1 Tax=Bacillus TaxID=1386 RepID=UPI0022497C2A|nr:MULTISPECIES: hypothetical protein [Bacillus]MCX2828370.1 hypothetical protein [Bacillus sp. DHT2]MDR4915042.1 hypothetical protein [Bacillus pseudomycoides]
MTKKVQNFKSLDSLKSVEKVIKEAELALKDKNRLIINSSIRGVLGAALGSVVGGGISFTAIYYRGEVGVSGPGIMTGLTSLGRLVGGGALEGIFVAAVPVAAGAVLGYAALNRQKNKKYQEASRKLDSIQDQLEREVDSPKERIEYLNSLIILLSRAVEELKEDLATATKPSFS